MPKKHVPKVAVSTPLTEEELEAKIKDKGTAPKGMFPFEISDDDSKWERPEFTYVSLDAVGYHADEVGVDGNGKEHKFPGGVYIRFNWAAKGIGFGQFGLKKLTDGTMEIDTEGCGREFFARALCALVNQATDSHEKVFRRMKKAKRELEKTVKSDPQVH